MIKRGATHDNPTPWIHSVMQIFALFMFLGMLTSLLVPESKQARLEALAGEKEDVYELQASQWRNRRNGGVAGDMKEQARVQRASGSTSTEGMVRDSGDGEKKWWRFREREVHAHAV